MLRNHRKPTEQVPGYRILRRLGEGATGAVYHAIQEGIDREVALKVFQLPDSPDDPGFRDEVEHERRIGAMLRHRNLARLHAAGEQGGRHWLAWEYLSGDTLSARIAGGMAPSAALDVLRDVVRGLAHAHERGIVHGDVKPGNILFRASDEAVLVDFGVAGLARPGDGRAQIHGGTPDYMSPEQASGEPIDARSDYYSLGVVLYEMLTGRLPFPSEPQESVARRDRQPPPLPPPRQWLQPLLDALLAPDPQDRPATAAELLELLASLCAAAPEAAGIGQRSGRRQVPEAPAFVRGLPANRNDRRRTLIFAVIGVLAFLLVLVLLLNA